MQFIFLDLNNITTTSNNNKALESPNTQQSLNQTEKDLNQENTTISTIPVLVPTDSNSTDLVDSTNSNETNISNDYLSTTDILSNSTVIDPSLEQFSQNQTTSNRTGNERALLGVGLLDGNYSNPIDSLLDLSNHIDLISINQTVSNETNSKLISSLESSTAPFCLETEFSCPAVSLISIITPKAKRSIQETLQPTSTPLQCLDKDHICDGIVDCAKDSFDEANCGAIKCGQNFMCGSMPAKTTSIGSYLNSSMDLMSSASGISMVNVTVYPNETLAESMAPNRTLLSSTTVAPFSEEFTQCIPRRLYW